MGAEKKAVKLAKDIVETYRAYGELNAAVNYLRKLCEVKDEEAFEIDHEYSRNEKIKIRGQISTAEIRRIFRFFASPDLALRIAQHNAEAEKAKKAAIAEAKKSKEEADKRLNILEDQQ